MSEGTGAAGANDQNIIAWTQFTPTTDFNDFTPWIDANGTQINIPNTTSNNPLWLRYENKNNRTDDRFIANLTQVITPVENLNITSRLGYDYEYDERLLTNRVGTITRLTGTFDVDAIQRRQINWDGIVDYSANFGDIQITGLAGFNYNARVFDRERLQAQDLAVPELLNPAASQTTVPLRGFSESRLMGLYGQVDLGYKNWLTLTLTGRNDWSSTLPLDNNSYFYPSVSSAFVFTDAFDIANNIISFGKLRASWAQVGNTADPYALDFRFFPEATADGQYSLNLNFPFNGQLGLNKTNTIPNVALIPERQTSVELGTELQLLDGRVGLDLNYYTTSNENQIIDQPIPQSTGFSLQTVNAAKLKTSGFEITLDAEVVNSGGILWNSTVNFSTNEVSVNGLGTEFTLLPGSSAFSSVQVTAVDGGSVEIRGIPWERDSVTRRPLINPNTGRRIPGEAKSFGGVFPDAIWGFTNQISYKGVTLSVTIDGKIGGKLKSATVESLWDSGFTTETVANRQGTFIDLDGVIKNEDGTVRANDVPVRSAETFWENLSSGSITEHSIFDADFIKLREVGLSYNFPPILVNRTPFSAIQVGVEGRNLALLYSKVPHIDPEANLFGSGAAGFGVERNAVPSTRSIGANVRLRF